MKFLHNMTIKRKLTLILMVTSITAVLLACIIFITFSIYTSRQRYADDLTGLAEVVGHNCQASLVFDIPEDAEKILSALNYKPSIIFAGIYKADGSAFAVFNRDKKRQISLPAVPVDNKVFAANSLKIFKRIYLNNQMLGAIYIQDDMRDIYMALKRNIIALASVMMLAMLVTYFISSALQIVISKPILSLAETTGIVSAQKDYSIRAEKQSNDEVGLLIDSFNEMLFQIQQRDDALRKSEEKYSGLLERLNEAVYRMSLPDGRYEYFSAAAIDVFGYSSDEFIHKPFLINEIVHPDFLEYFKAEWEKLLKGEVTTVYEYKIIDSNGEERWILQTNTGLFDDNGKITAIEGCCTDITQRKQAQDAIRASEEKYRNLHESIRDGFIKVDLEGKIVEFNIEYLTMLGYSADEAYKLTYLDLTPKRWHAVEKEIVQKQIMKKGYSDIYEKEYIKKDGTIFPVELRAYLVRDEKNKPTAMWAIVRDITERKTAEKELTRHRNHLEDLVYERTKELETAQAELVKSEKMSVLGRLTATVSHELRNPLGVIRSSVFFLKRKLGATDEKNTKHLNRIEQQVELCDTIVDELLEFTRGRRSEVVPGEINQLIEEVLEQIEELEQVRMECDLDSSLPFVPFDNKKMRRVLINLINNAIQASKTQSEKMYELNEKHQSKIKIKTSTTEKGICIDIEDNGTGMDSETLKNAFEPLYTTRARGTGLGLSVVKKIIEEHDGWVTIVSEPEQGTKVSCILPVEVKRGAPIDV